MNAIQTEALEDADHVARRVAQRVVDIAASSINARGRCVIALAGGSTPKRLYQLLATDEFREQITWERVHLFLSDERYVPNDHDDSNFRMAQETLLGRVSIPQQQVHPVPTDRDPVDAAKSYEDTIRQTLEATNGEIPAFDLVLLGIGPDAHTASLFPNTGAIDVVDRLVTENWVPQQDAMRITFTIPLLRAARSIILMATGEDKAEAVRQALQGPENLAETPSQCLREAQGEVTFVLDRAAASRLAT